MHYIVKCPQEAEKAGCQQVLWVFGGDQEITEVGAMNIFILLRYIILMAQVSDDDDDNDDNDNDDEYHDNDNGYDDDYDDDDGDDDGDDDDDDADHDDQDS